MSCVCSFHGRDNLCRSFWTLEQQDCCNFCNLVQIGVLSFWSYLQDQKEGGNSCDREAGWVDNLEGKLEGMEARIEAWVRVNEDKKLAKEDNRIGWVMENSEILFIRQQSSVLSNSPLPNNSFIFQISLWKLWISTNFPNNRQKKKWTLKILKKVNCNAFNIHIHIVYNSNH